MPVRGDALPSKHLNAQRRTWAIEAFMSQQLPPRPNLEHLRNQAKALLETRSCRRSSRVLLSGKIQQKSAKLVRENSPIGLKARDAIHAKHRCGGNMPRMSFSSC
jgi:hypothetical protein